MLSFSYKLDKDISFIIFFELVHIQPLPDLRC